MLLGKVLLSLGHFIDIHGFRWEIPKKFMDWKKIAYLSLVSRSMDEIEESKLLPEKKVLYQFSSRGHEVPQIILGSLLTEDRDGVGAYYRSRPLLLSLGLSVEDSFASNLARSGGFSDGRDIGVVCNLPKKRGAIVLPMSGDVGSQYTPTAGWAQSIVYHSKTLKDKLWDTSIAVTLGGEGSVATNGFWSALTIATTLKLPMLFYIEDNEFAISVKSTFQTPGCNIAKNLSSFENLKILDGDGSDIEGSSSLIKEAVSYVRARNGPALLRLKVPRLSGHSGQDTQSYKGEERIKTEKSKDPLMFFKEFYLKNVDSDWDSIQEKAKSDVLESLESALNREPPNPSNIQKHVFFEESSILGGLDNTNYPTGNPDPDPTRINMVTAIRRTLEFELKANPKVLVFGEDIGPKGGVHAVTLGLQETFGEDRVFDTSLSEEGIIGRAVGMAISGLMPVPEIQFRKYADPATEQLNNCGTMRWRTNNRFSAPIVVRIPGGYAKCGDPWHSVSSEITWIHQTGWKVCMPSNAEDAVGLLRTSLRGQDPVIFFEHRHQYDSPWARRPYPGDSFLLPFGKGNVVKQGTKLTLITWGAMVERALEVPQDIEVIDLRTLSPWDKECVINSVKRTRRALVFHEDGITCGFGAEIASTIAKECFMYLDAPVDRIAVKDIPIPYNMELMDHVVPTVQEVSSKVLEIINY